MSTGITKASNLLLSYKNPEQVYLVTMDLLMGTAQMQLIWGKEDPQRCYGGTLEFTSIDACHGVTPL